MNENRDKPMQKIQVYMDLETLRKFKAWCALEGKSMTQAIGECVKKIISKQG